MNNVIMEYAIFYIYGELLRKSEIILWGLHECSLAAGTAKDSL